MSLAARPDPPEVAAPHYPDQPNPDLLERIPLTAGLVLDCGCATGALGLAYKRRNPRARYLGVEAEAAAALVAAERLDEVAHADLDSAALPFDLDREIDCLVHGDVLEHLRDPWSVLKSQTEALAPEGLALLSVPNVAHWSVIAGLLAGSFDYTETGLMDRTHLRWFTFDSMRRMIEAAGLLPLDVHPRIFGAEQAQPFLAAIAPAIASLGLDREEFARRALPLQYVWRAQKRRSPMIAISASMLPPVAGVSDTRVIEPMRALASVPGVLARIAPPEPLAGAEEAPRIAVLHRPVLAGPASLAQIRSLRADGYLIVTEFDDHPDYFPALRGDDVLTFAGVHAVQTTTEPLADVLRPRNPEVAIFPNGIRELPAPVNFADPTRLSLFFGALNREADWAPFLPVLNQTLQELGSRLFVSVVHDRAFFEAIDTPHKRFTPTCTYEIYMALMGQCEIAFMPLDDTPFNRCKSDLKLIEAGAARLAALASPTVYGPAVREGETGLILREPEDLRTALRRLLAYPEAARAIAERARAWVRDKRMLAYQVEDRLAWYRSLWQRRAELDAAQLTRVPALAG